MNTLTAKQTKDKLSYTLDLTSGIATMNIQCFNSMKGNLSLVDEMLHRLQTEGIERVQLLFFSRGTRKIKVQVKEEEEDKKEEEKADSTDEDKDKAEDDNKDETDKGEGEDTKEKEEEAEKEKPKPKKFKEITVFNSVCFKHSSFDLREESVNNNFDRVISCPVNHFMHFYKANLPYILHRSLMDFVELNNEPDEDGFVQVRNLRREKNNLRKRLYQKMDSITNKARRKLKQANKKFTQDEDGDEDTKNQDNDQTVEEESGQVSENDTTPEEDNDDDAVSDLSDEDKQEIEHESSAPVATV